jgi:hypothetical protein
MVSKKLALSILLLVLALIAASLLALASHPPRYPTAQAQDGDTPPATYGIFYKEENILLYGFAGGDYELIADSTDFSRLGERPGVSDDGDIVVFYGDLRADAPLPLPDPGE